MRHCFGEDVDVYEVTANKKSKALKKAAKAVQRLENTYSDTSRVLCDMRGTDSEYSYAVLIYAHR